MNLASKYRPMNFNDVLGQDVNVKILKKQLDKKQFSNCYLFCGPSGTGKTTVARIFANAVNNNQGKPIEIDAASNNGVDNVRDIIKSANERSLSSEYKIYIIDEAHALTNQAWQAFLKCIEEPPKYTMFIFCTTDPQKLPDTIKNRMMRFNFTKVDTDLIKNRLIDICMQEGIVNYTQSVEFISKLSFGCVRQAIAYLDKVSSISPSLSIETTMRILGDSDYSVLFKLVNGIVDKNAKNILEVIEDVHKETGDLKSFVDKLVLFVLDLTKYTVFKSTTCLTYIPDNLENDIKYATGVSNSQESNVKYFNSLLNKLYSIRSDLRNDEDSRLALEVLILGILNESV